MKHYWLIRWLEKWPDNTVKVFKTAVDFLPIRQAIENAENELRIRSKANNTICLIYSVGVADSSVADLVGKAETDVLGIDWPE